MARATSTVHVDAQAQNELLGRSSERKQLTEGKNNEAIFIKY